MLSEIRIYDPTLLESALSNSVDIVSLGHEGCFHKLPTTSQLCAAAEKTKLKLVLPRLFSRQLEKVVTLVAEVAKQSRQLEVTVNDYGSMRELGRLSHVHLVAGRLLCKAFEEHPQAAVIAKRYPAAWRPSILQANIFDRTKQRLLMDYGIKAVEVALTEHTSAALCKPDSLAKGLAVHGFPTNTLGAVFRCCPVAKSHVQRLPGCKSLCRQPLELFFSQPFPRSANPGLQGCNPECFSLLLAGNVLLRVIEPQETPKLVKRKITYLFPEKQV